MRFSVQPCTRPLLVSLGLAFLFLASCASTPPPRAAFQTGGTASAIPKQSALQDCELRSFVAWDAARNVLLFHETEAQLLAGPHVGPFQIALYSEIFAAIANQGMRDYNRFAAEHFLGCAKRVAIPIRQGDQQAAACFARLDILMVLRARMLSGQSEGEAVASAKRQLTSRSLYPEGLIEELTPETYSAPSEDAFFQLRRSVFESCVLLR